MGWPWDELVLHFTFIKKKLVYYQKVVQASGIPLSFQGVQLDRMDTDDVDEVRSTPSSKQDMEGKELYSVLKQQKHLHNMTNLALRKNQPLIILNLLHEKDSLLMAEDLDCTSKLEQTCLAALSMCLMPGGCLIEMSVDGMADEDPEVCVPSDKDNGTQISTSTILDSEMTAIVSSVPPEWLNINFQELF